MNFFDVFDKSIVFYCVVFGGFVNVDEVVKFLLEFGVDSNVVDVNGFRSFDVIVFIFKFFSKRVFLEYFFVNNVFESFIVG